MLLADGQYVIWLRAEQRRSVDWGGDPTNKAIAVQEGDSVRLSPRKSFERWREVVRNRSAPWLPNERADVAALRQSIVESLYSRAEREVRLAETLQRSLLPEVPDLPGWRLSARYEPAAGGRIGGDWYDAFPLPDGRFALVLGDVAGHGIAAAGTMAQLRNALRAYLVDGVSAVGAVERLNDFTALLLPGAFATLVVGCLDPGTGEIEIVLAGHPVPLLLDAHGGPARARCRRRRRSACAAPAYRSARLTLGPDEGLVLYSDGLIERRDEELSDSVQQLAGEIDRLGVLTSARTVFEAHRRTDASDDRTVVVLRRD